MRWAFDIDGVISTNPGFFQFLTYQLKKNGQVIHIVTTRNPRRKKETVKQLKDWHISYDCLATFDLKDRSYESQGKAKANYMNKYLIDIWFDNDLKVYEEVCGVPLDIIAPNTDKILV